MRDFHLKRHVTIRIQHNFHVLKIDDILFLETSGLKTKVHHVNRAIQIIELTLSDVESRLKTYPFWRTDENHLINLKYLEKVSDKENGTVLMRGGYKVPIDAGRKKLLIQELDRIV